jgi:hypothetical protein
MLFPALLVDFPTEDFSELQGTTNQLTLRPQYYGDLYDVWDLTHQQFGSR